MYVCMSMLLVHEFSADYRYKALKVINHLFF